MSVTVIRVSWMSATVITDYHFSVGRWEPDSRGRLAEAAMALFGEEGFDNTTVAAIAERAGLTERTFFRHFADKREVLFGGAAMLQQFMVDAIAAAPDTASPLEMVVTALDALESVFTDRQFSLQRQAV